VASIDVFDTVTYL